MITYNAKNCPGEQCNICQTCCPTGVFAWDKGILKIDNHRCTNCGICISECPNAALKMNEIPLKNSEKPVMLFPGMAALHHSFKKIDSYLEYFKEMYILIDEKGKGEVIPDELRQYLASKTQVTLDYGPGNIMQRMLAFVKKNSLKHLLRLHIDERPFSVELAGSLVKNHHRHNSHYSQITRDGIYAFCDMFSEEGLFFFYEKLKQTESRGLLDFVQKNRWKYEFQFIGNELEKQVSLRPSATIVIESQCNSRCSICNFHSKDSPLKHANFRLNYADFKRLTDRLLSQGINQLHLCGVGEPMLNPDLFKMVKYLKKMNQHTSLLCNGTLIDKYLDDIFESGLDHLQVSFDSGEKQQFEKLRRHSSWDKIINNLAQLVKRRNNTGAAMEVSLWFVLMKNNYKSLKGFLDIVKTIGIDFAQLSSLIPYGFNTDTDVSNVINSGDRSIVEDIRKSLEYAESINVQVRNQPFIYKKREKRTFCRRMYCSIMVNAPSHNQSWLGNITFGCPILMSPFSPQGSVIGNIFKTDFESIWNGPTVKFMRKQIQENPLYHCQNLCPFL